MGAQLRQRGRDVELAAVRVFAARYAPVQCLRKGSPKLGSLAIRMWRMCRTDRDGDIGAQTGDDQHAR